MNQRSPLRNLSKGSDKNNPRNKGFDGFLKTNKQTKKSILKIIGETDCNHVATGTILFASLRNYFLVSNSIEHKFQIANLRFNFVMQHEKKTAASHECFDWL